MEILNGNKLIAEFMGYKFNAYSDLRHNNITKPNKSEWYYASWELQDFEEHIKKELNYDSSWALLMPVVEKINTVGFTVHIKGVACMINANVEVGGAINGITGYGFIGNVWHSVVHLVKWYNAEIKNVRPIENPQCGVGENIT